MASEFTKIDPSQKIPLTRQLEDGSSAPTRYVQAAIINYLTRAVIATVDLTDNGNGDFSNYDNSAKDLGVSKKSYFEVITKVYKDAGYITEDRLRYGVVKAVYYVQEDSGGAILGGREVEKVSKIDFDLLVKKIFGYNKLGEHRNKKSFANKFLTLEKISKDTNQKLSKIDLKKQIKNGFENLNDNIGQLADLSLTETKKIIKSIPNYQSSIIQIENKLKLIQKEISPLKTEIVKLVNYDIFERIRLIEKDIKLLLKNISGISIEKFDISEEINRAIKEIEIKIDEFKD